MWNKIKNWLIKKLGGYTKAEYDDFSRFPVRHFEFIPPPQRSDIVTLCATGEYSRFDAPPEEWIKDRLVNELARQIKSHVQWAWNDDYCKTTKCLRGIVKVVVSGG